MKKQNLNSAASQKENKAELPGGPVYSPSDDIYSRDKREALKAEEGATLDEGLDVPGSDLDDANEVIGEEDEENNYYSLGGDDHNDLEEE